MTQLTTHEAVLKLRQDPAYADVVHNTYLDADVQAAAERFIASAEFAAVVALLGDKLNGATVLDMGAGIGMAGYGLLRAGAAHLVAVEPDASDAVGRGAAARVLAGLSADIREGVGESLPADEHSVDIVYTRQVLHHTQDLPQVMREVHRVLKPGGVFIACREHVADNPQQLAEFLAKHPIHQLAGGEHAYQLDEYTGAITASGLALQHTWGMWDSLINAYPAVHSDEELQQFARTVLQRKLGGLGTLLAAIPGVQALVWQRITRPTPGRLYTFVAVKR